MNPIKFEGCNVVYAEDQPEYLPLPALRKEDGTITTCWELSSEEMETVKQTRKIYLDVMTFNKPLQPLLPYVKNEIPKPPLDRVVREGCAKFCSLCSSTISRSGFLGLFSEYLCHNDRCENSKSRLQK